MVAALDFLLLYAACSAIEVVGVRAFMRAVLTVLAGASAGVVAAAAWVAVVGCEGVAVVGLSAAVASLCAFTM